MIFSQHFLGPGLFLGTGVAMCCSLGDYYTFGTICYTCLILDVNYRAYFLSILALETRVVVTGLDDFFQRKAGD